MAADQVLAAQLCLDAVRPVQQVQRVRQVFEQGQVVCLREVQRVQQVFELGQVVCLRVGRQVPRCVAVLKSRDMLLQVFERCFERMPFVHAAA